MIDKEGTVRSQIVNDLPLGRNMDELIRLVDALQFHEEHGEVCPAGWNKGDKGMTASPAGVAEYLSGNSDKTAIQNVSHLKVSDATRTVTPFGNSTSGNRSIG